MDIRRQSGFTIIEVMLFISISAILATALMVGWTVTINTQSYRDSARSFAAILQQQYTDVVNVANGREDNLGCRIVNGATAVSEVNQTPLGQSDCVIMGRIIELHGPQLTMNTVVGFEPATLPEATEPDEEIILDYLPARIDSDIIPDEESQIPWSSRPYRSSGDASTAHAAILIIRSPETGTVYTYTTQLGEGGKANVRNLIRDGSQDGLKLCLDPEAPIAQGRMAVVIGAFASSANAIKVLADEEAAC